MPYKFNGKELDEETGLYYYGARYMDPKISMWLGVDPLKEKYPNVTGYCYTMDNPIRLIDSDGKEVRPFGGQHGGTMKNREHFLINGLNRIKGALKHRQSSAEKVTWFVYSDGTEKYGYSDDELSKYREQAKNLDVEMKVVGNTDDIVDYVNNKTGGESRANDKITSFYYIGHATPGDLNAGYNGGFFFDGDEFDADQFKSSAFAKGAWINVTAACRTAIGGCLEKSIVDQFAKKVDRTSQIFGSDVRVFFEGGVRTDAELLKKNGGKQIKKYGRIW